MLENETLNMSLLTTEGVLETLTVREENTAAEQERRTLFQAEAVSGRAACEEEAADRVRLREGTRRAQIYHAVWLKPWDEGGYACTISRLSEVRRTSAYTVNTESGLKP